MVNNSTNINKTKESLNSESVMVNNSTNINKVNNLLCFPVCILVIANKFNDNACCMKKMFLHIKFYIPGKKNYLPPSYLVYGFAMLFKVRFYF